MHICLLIASVVSCIEGNGHRLNSIKPWIIGKIIRVIKLTQVFYLLAGSVTKISNFIHIQPNT